MIAWSLLVRAQSPEALRRKAFSDVTSLGERHALLSTAWHMDTSDVQIRYELAMSSVDLGFQREAIRHLSCIYAKEEGKIFPNNLYYLAQLHHRLGMTLTAIELYEKFLRRHKASAETDLIRNAKDALDRLKWAQKHGNSGLSFIRSIYPQVDSLGPAQLWSKEMSLHSQMRFIGADSSYMYMNLCDDECAAVRGSISFSDKLETGEMHRVNSQNHFSSMNEGVFSATSENGSFLFVDSSGVNFVADFPPFDFSQTQGKHITPFFCRPDKLYFSSDRAGGQGGLDIWCTALVNGRWSEPQNLGKPCNTPGDESFPVVYDSVLYFSSNGHMGFGGWDVFAMHQGDSRMIHLAGPVCSAADDVAPYFLFSDDSAKGRLIWSSNRSVDTTSDACCFNIWYADLGVHEKTFTAERFSQHTEFIEGMESHPLQLYFHNDEPDPRSKSCSTSLDYQSCIQSYLSFRHEYENHCLNANDTIVLNQFFDQGLEYSSLRIDTLAQCILNELTSGFNTVIMVRGFTSRRAAAEYNQCLSGRRVACFENTLRKWKAGVLGPYIDSGSLKILSRPMGEDTLWGNTEDDIYSYSSCMARRIEVLQLLSGHGEVLCTKSVSLGHDGNPVPLRIMNVSNKPLILNARGLPDNVWIPKDILLKPGEETAVAIQWISEASPRAVVQAFYDVDLLSEDGIAVADFRLKIIPLP